RCHGWAGRVRPAPAVAPGALSRGAPEGVLADAVGPGAPDGARAAPHARADRNAAQQAYVGFVAAWMPAPGAVRRWIGRRGRSPASRCHSAISSGVQVPDRMLDRRREIEHDGAQVLMAPAQRDRVIAVGPTN